MLLLFELILLFAAAMAAAYLGLDLWRRSRSGEDQSAYVERLAGDEEPTDEAEDEEGSGPLAVEVGPLERRIDAAGLPFDTVGYLVLLALVGVVVIAAALLLLPRLPLVGVLVGLLTVYIVHVAIGEWGQFRARRFEKGLVQAVDFIISSLLAGENAVQAISNAASTSRGSVRHELQEVVRRLEVGLDIRHAIAPMVRSYDTESVRLFAQTLAVKWQVGGDLAPVLETLVWIMRERIRVNLRLRTELTGVQLAGILVALLPYLLLPVFLAQRPEWTEILMVHPWGPPMLAGAILLQLIGLLWLRRILRIEL